jgi:hypothetical protein
MPALPRSKKFEEHQFALRVKDQARLHSNGHLPEGSVQYKLFSCVIKLRRKRCCFSVFSVKGFHSL